MNKTRRKTINTLSEKLQELAGPISDLKQEFEVVRDEEQSAFDNMPESMQDGEKGEAISAAIEQLDEIVNSLDRVCEDLDEAITNTEGAVE